ncbi:hypothetical protein C7T35_09060 [Variovorax sp. WS11]|nr:hypothetical protein C7T35_09060 [Variovorax sp. WS11]
MSGADSAHKRSMAAVSAALVSMVIFSGKPFAAGLSSWIARRPSVGPRSLVSSSSLSRDGTHIEKVLPHS